MLPISTDLLRAEVKSAKEILVKWEQKLEAGVPALEQPGAKEALEEFVREMCGELLICSGKCENIVGLFE